MGGLQVQFLAGMSAVQGWSVTWRMRGNQLHVSDPIGGPPANKLIKGWVKVG
jgi:hypothetical protein